MLRELGCYAIEHAEAAALHAVHNNLNGCKHVHHNSLQAARHLSEPPHLLLLESRCFVGASLRQMSAASMKQLAASACEILPSRKVIENAGSADLSYHQKQSRSKL